MSTEFPALLLTERPPTSVDLVQFTTNETAIHPSIQLDSVIQSEPIVEVFHDDFRDIIASSWKRAEKRSFISSVVVKELGPQKVQVERVMESRYHVPYLLQFFVSTPIKLTLVEKTFIDFEHKRAAALTTLVDSKPNMKKILADAIEQVSYIESHNGITHYNTILRFSNCLFPNYIMPLLFKQWALFQNRIDVKKGLPLLPSPSPAEGNDYKH